MWNWRPALLDTARAVSKRILCPFFVYVCMLHCTFHFVRANDFWEACTFCNLRNNVTANSHSKAFRVELHCLFLKACVALNITVPVSQIARHKAAHGDYRRSGKRHFLTHTFQHYQLWIYDSRINITNGDEQLYNFTAHLHFEAIFTILQGCSH